MRGWRWMGEGRKRTHRGSRGREERSKGKCQFLLKTMVGIEKTVKGLRSFVRIMKVRHGVCPAAVFISSIRAISSRWHRARRNGGYILKVTCSIPLDERTLGRFTTNGSMLLLI